MFEGVSTALVTPFRDGAIDEPALRDLVEFQIEAGIDALVPCGSTGESATMSHAEHRRVVEIVVAAAGGRVPVMAGTGSNNTREAIELTGHAKAAGADGALLISPYYNKPTQEGIVAHYTEIARATDFPLIVYNIPGRTASNLLPTTIARLAELDRIVGVKEACGDLVQVSEVIAACPDDFAVLSGDDALTLPLLAVGGRGVISTTSNVAPAEMVALVRSFLSGDVERARECHLRLLPLFDALFCETNPIPVKAAVSEMGRIGPEIRLPLTEITQPNRERLKVVMKELGILGMTDTGRVLVIGALGRMGERVREAVAGEPALRFAAALEAAGHPGIGSELEAGVRVEDDPKAVMERADVAIDFSVPAATLANLRVAADTGIAYVTGTTGFRAEELDEIAQHAARIPVLQAPNFSLAVNVLAWLTREAARRLGSDYDAEIVELHHAAKRDAPSGTALRLGEAIAAGRGQTLADHLILERAGDVGARPDSAIGIQTLRGGDNPGEHTVLFAGKGERLELIHRSHTRDHFARGAVRAATWLRGRAPGAYRIEEVLGLD